MQEAKAIAAENPNFTIEFVDVVSKGFDKTAFPPFRVCLDKPAHKTLTIELSAYGENGKLSDASKSYHIQGGTSEVKIQNMVFQKVSNKREVWFQAKLIDSERNTTIATAKSPCFVIASKRSKNRPDKIEFNVKTPIDTPLALLSGIGEGYAKRFAVANIRTVKDLATCELKVDELHRNYILLTDLDVLKQTISNVLRTHKVEDVDALTTKLADALREPSEMPNHAHNLHNQTLSIDKLKEMIQTAKGCLAQSGMFQPRPSSSSSESLLFTPQRLELRPPLSCHVNSTLPIREEMLRKRGGDDLDKCTVPEVQPMKYPRLHCWPSSRQFAMSQFLHLSQYSPVNYVHAIELPKAEPVDSPTPNPMQIHNLIN